MRVQTVTARGAEQHPWAAGSALAAAWTRTLAVSEDARRATGTPPGALGQAAAQGYPETTGVRYSVLIR